MGILDGGFADVGHGTAFDYYFSLPSVHTTSHVANFVFLRSLGSTVIAVLDAVFWNINYKTLDPQPVR